MNKFNEVVCVSEEIDGDIRSLNEEISSLEILYSKMNKINMLKNENEELEKNIELLKKELEELEIANGKREIQPSIKMQVKEVNLREENSKNETAVLISKNKSASITQGRKAQKKEIQKEKSTIPKGGSGKQCVAAEETLPIDIGRLDLKVGKIMKVERHKDADTLYVEQVDIGAKVPITVVSGLVKHLSIQDMENRLVVVLCNLKPAKMRGITSEAMLMCASTPDKVEMLFPSPTSKPGDMVTVPGYPPPINGPEPILNPKKKFFETLAPELVTDTECFATFRGVRWEVPGGYVRSATLCGVNIK